MTAQEVLEAWLGSLSREQLLDLLDQAMNEVLGMAGFLRRTKVAADGDPVLLAEEVRSALGGGIDYSDDILAYLDEARPVLELMAQMSESPTLELLRAQETAIEALVASLAEVYDYDGSISMEIEDAVDLHRSLAQELGEHWTDADRVRLAQWLFQIEFGDAEYELMVEVDSYAQALGEVGLAEFRRLLGTVAEDSGHDYRVRHELGRLAIHSGDPEQIIQHFGSSLDRPSDFAGLVRALDQAGLPDLAVEYAERGLKLDPDWHSAQLSARLILDAQSRGDLARITQLRHGDFNAWPNHQTYRHLEQAAADSNEWQSLGPWAAEYLAEHAPTDWVDVLLEDARDDDAWEFAVGNLEGRDEARWRRLCARRARTHPEDTLGVYRRLVADRLRKANVANYEPAATMLAAMRDAAEAAGLTDEFESYLEEVVEANRRRPRCMEEFRARGLIESSQAAR